MRLISARSVVRIHLSPPKKKWAMERTKTALIRSIKAQYVGEWFESTGAHQMWAMESGYTSSLIRYGDHEKAGCMTIYLNKELLRYIGRQTAEGTMTTK